MLYSSQVSEQKLAKTVAECYGKRVKRAVGATALWNLLKIHFKERAAFAARRGGNYGIQKSVSQRRDGAVHRA